MPASSSASLRQVRTRRVVPLALLLVALLMWLLVPLPASAVAWTATSFANPIMSSRKPDFRGSAIGLDFMKDKLRQSIAWHVHQRLQLPDSLSDEHKIVRHLAALKPLMISQTELWHTPLRSPITTGLGWCDGVNGFAGLVLSNEFATVETVAVYDQELRAGHTYGRVWSKQYGDWLYFDAWTDEVVVFRSRGSGAVEYLAKARPLGNRRLAGEAPDVVERMHKLAPRAFVIQRHYPTLAQLYVARTGNLASHGDVYPKGSFEQVVAGRREYAPAAPSNVSPAAAQAFMAARIDHLLGRPDDAKRGFRRVIEIEGEKRSVFGEAAEIFVERLEGHS
jgi:hypothetical protein